MAEFPMMPVWVGDLLGDKNVMVMMGDDFGAYMLLMLYAWQNDGAIPDDPQVLQCIARTRASEWPRVWGKVKECWTHDPVNRCYRQGRVAQELQKCRNGVENKRRAGVASAKSRGYRPMKRLTGVQTHVQQVIEHTGDGDGDGYTPTGGDARGGPPEVSEQPPTGPDPTGQPTLDHCREYATNPACAFPVELVAEWYDRQCDKGWGNDWMARMRSSSATYRAMQAERKIKRRKLAYDGSKPKPGHNGHLAGAPSAHTSNPVAEIKELRQRITDISAERDEYAGRKMTANVNACNDKLLNLTDRLKTLVTT